MRAVVLGEQLRQAGHEVHYFTCCDATDILIQKFGIDNVHHMPTPRFVYSNGRVNSVKTTLSFFQFLNKNRRTILRLSKTLADFDAVITDYEPLLSRAAHNSGTPVLSFNSQSFVDTCTFEPQYWPMVLQMKLVNRLVVFDPDFFVVTKPTKNNVKRGRAVGPLIRNVVKNRRWRGNGNHVLVYSRESIKEILPRIKRFADSRNLEMVVYGHPFEGATNKPIGDSFIDDMLSAKCIFGTAGTQFIGEVAHVGAPTLLIPEVGQTEQQLNARLASDDYPNIDWLRPSSSQSTIEYKFGRLSGLGESHIEDGSEDAFKFVQVWLLSLNP